MSEESTLDARYPNALATPDRLAGLLADVTHKFASSLNVEETLQNAIDQIIVYLNAEAASIFLLDDSAAALVCRKCAGPVDITGLTLRPDEGIVGDTVSLNAPQIVRDVSTNEHFAQTVDEGTGFVTRSIMCAPLTVRGECIGALELINKRSGDRLFAASDMHLATAVASAAALAIHNANMAQALIEQERVQKELELARQIQLSLIPPNPTTSFPVHGLNIPAREVSGDFYDFCEVADSKIYFSLADVSGKGMNAAILMAKTTSLLRCLAKTEQRPDELLRKVNAEICETSSLGMFVTIVAGYIYPDTGVVEFSNAGHQPPLFWQHGESFEEFGATSPPIGIMPETQFETTRVTLGDGNLFIFTDGLTESLGVDNSELGVDGLFEFIKATDGIGAADRLDAIIAHIHAQERRINDDLTLLMIEMPGNG